MNDRPKTAECWRCAGREGFVGEMIPVSRLIGGKLHYPGSYVCVDRFACDRRMDLNAAKARVTPRR